MTLLSRVLNQSSEKAGSKLSRRSASSKAALGKHSLPRISLKLNLESPPLALYGHAHESSGSIISGVLTLDVEPRLSPQTSHSPLVPYSSMSTMSSSVPDSNPLRQVQSANTESDVVDETLIDSVVLTLVQTVHYTKPFMVSSNTIHSCSDCNTRKTTLARWDVLTLTHGFTSGAHAFPFSHLLPGSLAASAKLGNPHSYSFIKYDLVAVAKYSGKKTEVILPLNILRSILRGPDRNSLRVFPPTEVTASAVLPGVMYPKSNFPIELRMDHVVNSKQDRRWRMRKLLWKLEEHTQVAPYACPKHAEKLQAIKETQKRGQLYKSLKSGNSPAQKSSGSTPSDGPSRSNGMHYSTIQTSMFVGRPPTTQQATIPTIPASAADTVPLGNQDIVEMQEETPSNRAMDEVVHFEEDFGSNSVLAPLAPSMLNVVSAESPNTDDETFELYVDELRVVAHGDIKSGWKSDFLGQGSIELVAEISALSCSSGIKKNATKASSNEPMPDEMQQGLRNDANIACDIVDPTLGIYVSHVLVIEVIVAEEIVQAPKTIGEGLTPVKSTNSSNGNGASQVGVPTGAARVLRMQFKVIVTERSGLGIAWDDEVPPTYDDVSALSPPTYQTTGTSLAAPTQQSTPSVIFGLGDTPVVGSFAPNRPANSIDQMTDLDDRIQEFRL